MKFLNFLTLFIAIVSLFGFSNQALTQTLAVTEYMANPNSLPDGEGEWIEIFNYGPNKVNLTNLKIIDQGSDSFVFNTGIIASGEYIILALNPTSFQLEWPTVTSQIFNYDDFILSNTNDEIIIQNQDSLSPWSLEYPSGGPTGSSTYLAVDNFLDNNYTSQGNGAINHNGNDGTGNLGYESNSLALDEVGSFFSQNGDIGSPGTGNYTASVPEPSQILSVIVAIGLGAFFFRYSNHKKIISIRK